MKSILELNLQEELDSAEDDRRVNSLTKCIELLSYDLDYYNSYKENINVNINAIKENSPKILNKIPIGLNMENNAYRKKSSFNESENELFDYNAKYLGESQEITPGNISKESLELIHKYVTKIYDNLELNGITRSEFIIVDKIPHILETNTIPGFTKQSIVPQQIEVQASKL